jgi:hypothetical protein
LSISSLLVAAAVALGFPIMPVGILLLTVGAAAAAQVVTARLPVLL